MLRDNHTHGKWWSLDAVTYVYSERHCQVYGVLQLHSTEQTGIDEYTTAVTMSHKPDTVKENKPVW